MSESVKELGTYPAKNPISVQKQDFHSCTPIDSIHHCVVGLPTLECHQPYRPKCLLQAISLMRLFSADIEQTRPMQKQNLRYFQQ